MAATGAASVAAQRWPAGGDDLHQIVHDHQRHENSKEITVSRWSEDGQRWMVGAHLPQSTGGWDDVAFDNHPQVTRFGLLATP